MPLNQAVHVAQRDLVRMDQAHQPIAVELQQVDVAQFGQFLVVDGQPEGHMHPGLGLAVHHRQVDLHAVETQVADIEAFVREEWTD